MIYQSAMSPTLNAIEVFTYPLVLLSEGMYLAKGKPTANRIAPVGVRVAMGVFSQ